jgi:hypothetical protein
MSPRLPSAITSRPPAACVGARLDECPHPWRAEPFEERELPLHRHGVRGDGVDDPAAETGHVAAKLDGEEIGPRVEPHDQLAALSLDLGGDPVAEGERRDSHPRQD